MNYSKKEKRIVSLQLSKGQVVILMALSMVSLVVSFYLGLVTGKSLRIETSVQQLEQERLQNEAVATQESLSFFQLGQTASKSSPIDLDYLEKLKNNTERLAQQGQKEEKPPPTTTTTLLPPLEVRTVKMVKTQTVGSYTLQVFSTGSSERANTFHQRLLDQGFADAYVSTYVTGDNKKLFRVRVGKTSKKEAEALAIQLKKVDFIDQVQLTKL